MKVSVIMSTYDDADSLTASIESVLTQDFADFEFIIVNDGSPDPRTAATLARCAETDPRIRVIAKPNEGLTRALIDGCAVARGEYLARIDVGDRYLPGRLARQVAYLDQHPEVVLVSCAARFVTVENDFLFERCGEPDPAKATATLRHDDVQCLRGVNGHGSTMFRRVAYEGVGGYRWQFYFAQDLDLWMRLTDHGLLAFLPDVLYEATIAPSGISGRYAREQRALAELIVRLRQRRAAGEPEGELLGRAASIRPATVTEGSWVRRRRLASGHYFVAQVLRGNGNPRCRRYYRAALGLDPLHCRAAAAYLVACLRPRA